MDLKKKIKRNKTGSTKNNYIIDHKGQKKFWLKKRVSKKEFKFLRFKFNFVYKKWIFKNKKDYFFRFFFNNFHILKNFIFFLFVKKCQKNIFANFSDIQGNVVYKASSGFFYKRSLRKTFFATGFLLRKMQNLLLIKRLFSNDKKKRQRNLIFFFNIIGGNYQRGFRKNLKDFIKKSSSKFFKITELKCKAHNGVRKSKRRRK